MELYYSSSENKGADQLHSYCEADLRLCFRLGKNPVFSQRGSHKTRLNPSLEIACLWIFDAVGLY